MKKIVLATAIVLAAAGIVPAQSWGSTVSVQGTLGLQNGVIAVISGSTVYYVPYLSRYVGFIDSLKEGAQVTVEGYQMGAGRIMPVKLTVSGKDYDFTNGYGGGSPMGYGAGYCGGGGRHHGWRRW